MAKKEEYKLEKPFTFEGEKVTAVTLRRPTGKDMILAEQEVKAARPEGYVPGEAELQLFMLARVMDKSIDFVEAMASADIAVLLQEKTADL